VRVGRECDPQLEIAEIADRAMKRPGGGPALLFERVRGSRWPLVINAFGSQARMARALGVRHLDEHAGALAELLGAQVPGTWWEKLKLLPKLARVVRSAPRRAQTAPCQEVIEPRVDLRALPVLTCWPKDGGPFLTLPVVITRDP